MNHKKDHMFHALAQTIVDLNNAKPRLPTAEEIEEAIFDFIMRWDYIKGELRPPHEEETQVDLSLIFKDELCPGEPVADLNEDSLLSAMVAIKQMTGPREKPPCPYGNAFATPNNQGGHTFIENSESCSKCGIRRAEYELAQLCVSDEAMGWTEIMPEMMPIGMRYWLPASEAVPAGWMIVRVETGMHMIEKRT